ncbi:MAG: polysaccharide deacetylase family protein, partial [Candidatus Zixiibacteriota bacterium]
MKNILTVDLEDWFVVENLKANIKFEEWNELSDRVVDNTNRLLELFDYYNVSATFFVLGWIAEKHPRLINRVSAMGHEVACHSYRHDRVDNLSEKQFREDTLRAVAAIEKACGITPVGYRAPSWSINSRVKWAYEELADMGFLYDSSMYPIKHDIYG